MSQKKKAWNVLTGLKIWRVFESWIALKKKMRSFWS